jgi:hypothetical protein
MARTVVRIQTISLRSPKQKLGRRTSGVDPIKINAETVLKRSGYTVFEVLALAFVLSATLCLWRAVTPVYGQRWGMLAAFGGGLLSVTLVVLLYRWSWRRDERLLQAARENYRKIYRVIAAPADPEIIGMADGAVIRVGDFGWEAGPARDDGLIYLQGLTREWTSSGTPDCGRKKWKASLRNRTHNTTHGILTGPRHPLCHHARFRSQNEKP